MNVTDAVCCRKSVRALLAKPVPQALLREALDLAAHEPPMVTCSPGACMIADPAEHPLYPPNLSDPYRTLRFRIEKDMYALSGIRRNNKLQRLQRLHTNYLFFNAPVGLFLLRRSRYGDRPVVRSGDVFTEAHAIA